MTHEDDFIQGTVNVLEDYKDIEDILDILKDIKDCEDLIKSNTDKQKMISQLLKVQLKHPDFPFIKKILINRNILRSSIPYQDCTLSQLQQELRTIEHILIEVCLFHILGHYGLKTKLPLESWCDQVFKGNWSRFINLISAIKEKAER